MTSFFFIKKTKQKLARDDLAKRFQLKLDIRSLIFKFHFFGNINSIKKFFLFEPFHFCMVLLKKHKLWMM